MAVSSQLTSLENFESAPSYFNVGSGGGASDNTDVFIEGAQSGGRRVDNATDKGFGAIFSSTDLSGAGEHVKLWVFCFHWSAVTAVEVRLSDGTNDDDHVYPVADIPLLGGWIPIWVDVSRTPETGGSANEAQIDRAGCFISIANVGGAGDNFIIDEIHHGTGGYLWSGTGGDMGDFRSFEASNVEGVLIDRGIDFLYARLTIGDSAATGFTDSGFTIVCPDQALVAADFMGLTADLQNASTAIDLSNFTLQSGNPTAATRRPDLVVSGSSGALDMDTATLNGLRTVLLNASCSLTNSTVLNSGEVVADGADCTGTKVLSSIVAADGSALSWDVNTDVDGLLDDMTFSKGAAAHHAVELGTTSPTSVTFRGMTATGFNASNGQNDSTFYVRRTSGTVTINVVGGTGNFSYKTDGATVNIVQDPVTTTVTVRDEADQPVQNARVLVEAGSGAGDLPYRDSVSITASGTTATVSHTAHGMETGDLVVIRWVDESQNAYNGVFAITVTGANSYTYTMGSSPSSPATVANGYSNIEASGVVLSGLTNASGQISASATYSVDQPVRGNVVAPSSMSPYYKAQPFTDTIDNVVGLSKTVGLTPDE